MPPPNDSSSELDFGATLRGLNPKQRLFDRYELREILGRGGMGVVWRAYDEQLERDVALKFLPELLVLDSAAMYELKRETKRSLELTHHHIVRIYDFAQDHRSACISMEYVDGQTLSVSRIGKQNKVFEIDDLGAVIEQACDALEYAHVKAKIVHRDLKPSNLMRNSRGELKVTDFGISRSLSDSVSMLSMRTSGTLVYMSPQQLDGERANPADDIYSLGATVYELLTGKPPFYSGGIERQIRDKVPEAIGARRSGLEIATGKVIPEHWEATIAACLAKDPIQRPRSAADVAKRLGLAVPQYERTAFLAPPGIALPEKAAGKAAEKTAEAAPPPKRNFAVPAIATVAALAGVLLVWYFGFFLPKETARKAQETRAAETEAKKKAADRSAQGRGALLVNTEPQGATVILGATSKKSPSSFNDVSIGTAHLKIFLDGYESVERDIEISENQINDPGVIRLVRLVGSAQIHSIPQSIIFDLIDADGGRQSGTTPATLTNLPTGPAEVIYKPSRGPSHSQRITVNVRATVASTWRLPESPSPIPDVSTAMPSIAPAPAPSQVVVAPTTAPPPDREFLGEYTYRGMVGPYEAIFHLKFEPGERVSGYYNLPKSARNDLILRLEGRNPTGKLYLNEYTNESLSARIDLTLNRSGTEIRWEGTMYNTDKRVFPVSFSRSR
ncbi:MAG TPA: protein kinase [Chthoniobacterales bacterium]|nr:protein kinase [Chthoniobacterales bacterium]